MILGSHELVFYKNFVRKNLAKFTEQHFCWCLFLDKVGRWRFEDCNVIFKKETPVQSF